MKLKNFHLVEAARNLKENAKLECGKLALQARAEGKPIYLIRNASNLYIGDALKHIHLDATVIEKVKFFYPVAKKHLSVCPDNLLLLCNLSGGLKQAVKKIHGALSVSPAIDDSEAHYLNQLVFVMEHCLSICTQSRIMNKSKSFLQYCCLCWRPIHFRSKYFCSSHYHEEEESGVKKVAKGQITNRQLRNSDEARLCRAIELRGDRSSEELLRFKQGILLKPDFYLTLYGWLFLLTDRSEAGVDYFSHIENRDYATISWKKHAKFIINTAKESFPHTYLKIKNVNLDLCNNWSSFVVEALNILDPIPVKKWNIKQESLYGGQWLLDLLRRHESYFRLQDIELKRGPQIGFGNKNPQLREEILSIASSQLKESGKVNAAQIARRVNLSRQRVSIILKELFL